MIMIQMNSLRIHWMNLVSLLFEENSKIVVESKRAESTHNLYLMNDFTLGLGGIGKIAQRSHTEKTGLS
ncbi:hypothetical protein FRX31_017708 [Thalictrum thalictroides]|uniref:Uncharacterized protein n=1 Tax=Thalictrum thalictroides TaxID=46969 RepID=A0A7J6W8K3_THATH|nr:hypothetical protein FRX31_017708 [Thalictrum thalictroides]